MPREAFITAVSARWTAAGLATTFTGGMDVAQAQLNKTMPYAIMSLLPSPRPHGYFDSGRQETYIVRFDCFGNDPTVLVEGMRTITDAFHRKQSTLDVSDEQTQRFHIASCLLRESSGPTCTGRGTGGLDYETSLTFEFVVFIRPPAPTGAITTEDLSGRNTDVDITITWTGTYSNVKGSTLGILNDMVGVKLVDPEDNEYQLQQKSGVQTDGASKAVAYAVTVVLVTGLWTLKLDKALGSIPSNIDGVEMLDGTTIGTITVPAA